MSVEDVVAVNDRVDQLLAKHQIPISSWHYCVHTPSDNCLCRKPRAGLFKEAATLHPVDWNCSVMVGANLQMFRQA